MCTQSVPAYLPGVPEMDSNWLRVCKHLRLGLITLMSSSTHYARTLRLRFAPPLSVPDVQNPPAPLFLSPCLSLCLFVCVLALTRRSRLALSVPRRIRGRVTCVFSAFQCCMLMLTSTHYSTPFCPFFPICLSPTLLLPFATGGCTEAIDATTPCPRFA